MGPVNTTPNVTLAMSAISPHNALHIGTLQQIDLQLAAAIHCGEPFHVGPSMDDPPHFSSRLG
jgi:hypothetical protein